MKGGPRGRKKNWTEADEQAVRTQYRVLGPVAVGRLLGRSHGAVSKKYAALMKDEAPEPVKPAPRLRVGAFDRLMCETVERVVGYTAARANRRAFLLVDQHGGHLTLAITTDPELVDKAPANLVGAWTKVRPGDVADVLRKHVSAGARS